MKRSSVRFLSLITTIIWGLTASFLTMSAKAVNKYPRTINYYLAELSSSDSFISQVSRYDVLVLSPAQIASHPSIIQEIRTRHPGIIILAYVPSQSYNTNYWPHDAVFAGVHVSDSWWLRDSHGAIVSGWPGIQNTNLQPAWSDYFLGFVRDRIANLPGVDGIFFDMVSHNISWLNHGDIDLDGDGIRDTTAQADALWLSRTEYFFKRASEILSRTYIVANGTSAASIQPYVNGRMFETFPTPWEGDGSWGTVMNNVAKIQPKNLQPNLTLLNSNTNNTGHEDYRAVRFGLASSLLANAYFGYDYGDTNHAQLWWYDEYDTNLGKPIGIASARSGNSTFRPDVWRRDFEQGIALVNSTGELATVDLGGEFEKITGKQDSVTNDGSIVSETDLAPNDGLILLKTSSSLNDVLFANGTFARFYHLDGSRVRNGFFVYEDNYKGGDQILHVDLDHNGERDTVVVQGNKVLAWRNDGQPFFKVYPYTANYRGSLHVAVGDLDNNGEPELYITPASGSGSIKVLNLIGEEIKPAWYPFGSKFKGEYSLAVAQSRMLNYLIVGTGTTVTLFDNNFKKIREWRAFGHVIPNKLTVATGDLNGDGEQEIAVGFDAINGSAQVKFFSTDGSIFASPLMLKNISPKNTQLELSDINFDGLADVVVMTSGSF